MDWLYVLILGIVQGLTEFLPISSSGHLVLAQYIMDVEEAGVILEVVLHLGTLAAILLYYFNDLKDLTGKFIARDKESVNYGFYLAAATIPAVLVGLFLNESIEATFQTSVVKWTLILTGLVLLSTFWSGKRPVKDVILSTALIIGIAQAVAILPGISRSGMTISAALLLGVSRVQAARFSFFMAIPVLFGAGVQQFLKLPEYSTLNLFPLLLGFISAALSGYLVIHWLITVISQGKFWLFSFYCFAVGILAIILIP